MDKVKEILLNSLDRYYKVLRRVGYKKDSDVSSIMVLSTIDYIFGNFMKFISEEDLQVINKVLYTIGGTCIVDYPTSDCPAGGLALPLLPPSISFEKTTNTVTITNPNSIGEIYYTTDNSIPTTGGELYEEPFVISESCTIKAVVVANRVSQIVSKDLTYTVPSYYGISSSGTVSIPTTEIKLVNMIRDASFNLGKGVLTVDNLFNKTALNSRYKTCIFAVPSGTSITILSLMEGEADITNTFTKTSTTYHDVYSFQSDTFQSKKLKVIFN